MGWYFDSNDDTPTSQTQPTLVSVSSATSGIEPWEISDWYATVEVPALLDLATLFRIFQLSK